MAGKIDDKVAIVTGGESGIGAATVGLFSAHGARVVSLDVADAPARSKEPVHYVKCDVSREDEVAAAVKQVADKFGRIDILVNCAGVMDGYERVGDVTNAAWEKVLGINLNGPFYLSRAVMPYLLANESLPPKDAGPVYSVLGQPMEPSGPSKGVIVNICSVAATGGGAAGTVYTVSKHALLGLSRSTAWMYRNEGVRCNVVLPGATMTGIYQNSKVHLDPAGQEACKPFLGCQVMELINPLQVAEAVLYLAGAERVTGAELAVDAGWRAV